MVKSAMKKVQKGRSNLSSKYGMTVSSFPFKESESSLLTTVGRNLRPTYANPPPPPTPLLLSISALIFGYSKSFISAPSGELICFKPI